MIKFSISTLDKFISKCCICLHRKVWSREIFLFLTALFGEGKKFDFYCNIVVVVLSEALQFSFQSF